MSELQVGMRLYGRCGVFGRGRYGEKHVEALGYRWVVTRDEDGQPDFACCDDTENPEHWEKGIIASSEEERLRLEREEREG